MTERFQHTILGKDIKFDTQTQQYFDSRIGIPAGGNVRRGGGQQLRNESAARKSGMPFYPTEVGKITIQLKQGDSPDVPSAAKAEAPVDGSKVAAQAKWGANLGVTGISTDITKMDGDARSSLWELLLGNLLLHADSHPTVLEP